MDRLETGSPKGRLPQIPVRRHRLSEFLQAKPARIGVLGFLVAITIGAILLIPPISSKSNQWTHPIDALFTSTSAVCVTGLIVKDTGGYFSTFGQVVILCLIQAGGLGIMTLSAFAGLVIGKQMSLRSQAALGQSIGAAKEGRGIVPLVKYIVALTLVSEALGCLLLLWRWQGEFPSWKGALYTSLFHAVSAFCNAGFSTFSDSLAGYRNDLAIMLIMAALIVAGGLGFAVIRNLNAYLLHRLRRRPGRPKLTVHSKLVLTVTAILIVGGALLLAIIEYHRAMDQESAGQRLLLSLFQSITTRTAGFNTLTISTLAPASLLMMVVFMFVGASPGSTGGGIKTTTFGIMIASVSTHLKGRERVEMYKHSIGPQTVHMVISVALLGVFCIVLGTFGLLVTERSPFLDTVFEATSAFGTVGLSLGLTAKLTYYGKVTVTILMFIGRLGPLTLLLTIAGVERKAEYEYPRAEVMVG